MKRSYPAFHKLPDVDVDARWCHVSFCLGGAGYSWIVPDKGYVVRVVAEDYTYRAILLILFKDSFIGTGRSLVEFINRQINAQNAF